MHQNQPSKSLACPVDKTCHLSQTPAFPSVERGTLSENAFYMGYPDLRA